MWHNVNSMMMSHFLKTYASFLFLFSIPSLLLPSSRLPQITLFKLYKYELNILPIEEAALYAQFVATGVIFDASAAAKGYVVSSVVQRESRQMNIWSLLD